ncbi:collagen alpha-1(I) chain-like [Anas acuta]
MIGRADIEGSKSDVAMNAWPPQASYPCGNFSDTSCLKPKKPEGSRGPAFTVYRPSQTPHLTLSPERVAPGARRALGARSESPSGLAPPPHRRLFTLETCCGYGYGPARDLHLLPRIFTGRRELTGRRRNRDAFQGAGPSLGANPFQGARPFTKKRELSPGLPPASPGSLALPHWAPRGARLRRSGFGDLNPTPFRSARGNGGHLATTTKICTCGGSTRARAPGFQAHRSGPPTRRGVAPEAPHRRRRPGMGPTLQRHPFSGLVDSAELSAFSAPPRARGGAGAAPRDPLTRTLPDRTTDRPTGGRGRASVASTDRTSTSAKKKKARETPSLPSDGSPRSRPPPRARRDPGSRFEAGPGARLGPATARHGGATAAPPPSPDASPRRRRPPRRRRRRRARRGHPSPRRQSDGTGAEERRTNGRTARPPDGCPRALASPTSRTRRTPFHSGHWRLQTNAPAFALAQAVPRADARPGGRRDGTGTRSGARSPRLRAETGCGTPLHRPARLLARRGRRGRGPSRAGSADRGREREATGDAAAPGDGEAVGARRHGTSGTAAAAAATAAAAAARAGPRWPPPDTARHATPPSARRGRGAETRVSAPCWRGRGRRRTTARARGVSAETGPRREERAPTPLRPCRPRGASAGTAGGERARERGGAARPRAPTPKRRAPPAADGEPGRPRGPPRAARVFKPPPGSAAENPRGPEPGARGHPLTGPALGAAAGGSALAHGTTRVARRGEAAEARTLGTWPWDEGNDPKAPRGCLPRRRRRRRRRPGRAGPGGDTRAERRGAEGEPGTRQPAPAPLGGASARGGAPAIRRHHLALLPGPGVSLRSPAPGGSCAREETRGSGRPRGADPTPAPRRRAPGRDAAAPRSHARPPRPPSLGRLPRRRRAPPPAPGTDGGAQGRTTERPRSPLPARARADGQRAGGGTADPRPAATPRPEGGSGTRAPPQTAATRKASERGGRAEARGARHGAAGGQRRGDGRTGPGRSGGGPAPGRGRAARRRPRPPPRRPPRRPLRALPSR